MKNYPKGSIKSINELLQFANKKVWLVSRAHCNGKISEYAVQNITGDIGCKIHSDGDKYYWYEHSYPDGFKTKSSLKDANVIENDYNDWFLFTNLEDAREYLGLCRCCGK